MRSRRPPRIAALDDTGYVEESRRLNREGMRQLEAGLRTLGIALPAFARQLRPGRSRRRPTRVYRALLRQGVIVRPVANYGLPAWLRVTVGTRPRTTRFLAALGTARRDPIATLRAD